MIHSFIYQIYVCNQALRVDTDGHPLVTHYPSSPTEKANDDRLMWRRVDSA